MRRGPTFSSAQLWTCHIFKTCVGLNLSSFEELGTTYHVLRAEPVHPSSRYSLLSSLELSAKKVYEPYTRVRFRTAEHLCEASTCALTQMSTFVPGTRWCPQPGQMVPWSERGPSAYHTLPLLDFRNSFVKSLGARRNNKSIQNHGLA